MTPAQPIFHALGLLIETVQRGCLEAWTDALETPVEAPGQELVVEGGPVWVLGSERKDSKQMSDRMINLRKCSLTEKSLKTL